MFLVFAAIVTFIATNFSYDTKVSQHSVDAVGTSSQSISPAAKQ
jgi:hypothetical protein